MSNIHKAIPEIMAEIGAVGKNGENKSQKYAYRAVDDVMARLQPALAKHGVTVYPVVKDWKAEQVNVGTNNTRMMHVIAVVEYHWCADDGSEIVSATLGEATDSGDKAANKAMASAYKYAVTQTLSIPTNEPKDTEIDHPELSESQPTSKEGWGEAPNPGW